MGFVIDFVGGPFDGHRQNISDKNGLADTVALSVSKHILELLQEKANRDKTTTSIALYEKEQLLKNHFIYRFLGSTADNVIID
jgi:hypothetical protein